MNWNQRDFWFSGLLLALCVSGCQNAQTTGRDPLLGKTRLDPPSTSARSVYVERQAGSGVVPGGERSLAKTPAPKTEEQSASAATQTVRYPNFGEDEKSSENAVPEKNVPAANSSHLRWRSLEQELPVNDSPTGSNDYSYVYDFSTFPARRVPVGRSTSSPDPYALPENAISGTESAPEMISERAPEIIQTANPGMEPAASQPQNVRCQLVADQFDPYAPHREFERRKMQLSQNLAQDFDQAPATSTEIQPLNVPLSTNSMLAVRSAPIEPKTISGSRAAASGWQVVSTPTVLRAEPSAETEPSAIAKTEPAEVSGPVGAQVSLPKPETKSQANGEKEAEKTSPVSRPDDSLNLLDLPERF